MEAKKKYWVGSMPVYCDICKCECEEFYDSRTIMGPWANLCPKDFARYGLGKTGTGYAQHYKLNKGINKYEKIDG